MELHIKIKAEPKEMREVFEFDEVLNIRHYEMTDTNTFRVIVRIPECKIRKTSNVISLSSFRNNVIKACSEHYPVIVDVVYSNGIIRRFFAPNDYWYKEYAAIYGEKNGITPVSFSVIQDNRNSTL